MTKTAIHLFFTALLLIIAQVIVFNRVCLFGVAVPFVFIYVLLRLPVTMSREWLYTVSFLTGLVIDVFSDTQGMNALTCTLTFALRRPVLRLYFTRDDELTNPCPGIASLGFPVYMKYALTMSLIYSTMIFIIESVDVYGPGIMSVRIISSAILTTAMLIGIDSLTLHRREKRS